ncbi:hypothetical protein HBI17_202910 [Parastagonospora nodorum]|nr:hypothetical protein HBI17_202910 [Parastagonospora nodorum]
MASLPLAKCCISGVLHTGTPVGSIKTIGKTQAYLSYPKDSSTHHAILLLTDVYGYTFPNTRLIADQFAARGYFTIIPDLFQGREVSFPAPDDFNLQTYIHNVMPRVETVDPIIRSVIEDMRNEMGVQKLGGVGYCFGGKYVCRWLKEGGLDAGFVAHPSFVDGEELKGVKGPMSIAAAESDDIFTVEKRRETEEILRELSVPWEMFLYSGVEHGFAVKGHMSTKRARFAKEQAFGQAVAWFEEYLKEE